MDRWVSRSDEIDFSTLGLCQPCFCFILFHFILLYSLWLCISQNLSPCNLYHQSDHATLHNTTSWSISPYHVITSTAIKRNKTVHSAQLNKLGQWLKEHLTADILSVRLYGLSVAFVLTDFVCNLFGIYFFSETHCCQKNDFTLLVFTEFSHFYRNVISSIFNKC